jgi:TPR repeat protein
MLKRFSLGLGLALLVALPATAQDFQKGLAAHKHGDYATALKEWRPLADQGDAKAQYKLGFMFERGRGVPQNNAQAVKWFRRAAEQGHARAQYSLGVRYTRGEGVLMDDAEAVKWFRRAAEQGHARAQYSLGLRYSQGKGVPTDIVQAYMWWSLAALEGHQKADGFRDSAAKLMTPAEIAKATKLAREWWAKHKKKPLRGSL